MAKKDTYYFPHDMNAQDDPKCVMLIEQLGMEGYGIFWGLIERLRHEHDSRLPISILSAFARRWNTSKEKIELVIRSYGLFVINEEYFFSERLIRSVEQYNTTKKKLSDAGKRGNEIKYGRVAIGLPSHGDPIKGKEIKGKEMPY